MKTILLAVALLVSVVAFAQTETKKNVKYRKTQEVNFDEQNIDGQVHSPDGAYLLQKRGVKFTPLYKVDQQMDKGIAESINYLK
jgi:ethanolamine utilization protein EutP (predicted NTPase)